MRIRGGVGGGKVSSLKLLLHVCLSGNGPVNIPDAFVSNRQLSVRALIGGRARVDVRTPRLRSDPAITAPAPRRPGINAAA